jgi:hypothetical protein
LLTEACFIRQLLLRQSPEPSQPHCILPDERTHIHARTFDDLTILVYNVNRVFAFAARAGRTSEFNQSIRIMRQGERYD